MIFPRNHSQRFDLSNEVHARPPEPLQAPANVTCLALLTPWPYCENDRDIVTELTRQFGATPPGPGSKHYSVWLSNFRLVWERHTEFTRYTFITENNGGRPFEHPAIEAAPEEWVANLPGEVIAAASAALTQDQQVPLDQAMISESFFSGNAIIGSEVTGGAATAFTDFRIQKDGFTRFLVQNKSMTPWHAGRVVQRLLEIETYRNMAMLALPMAQKLTGNASAWENELSEITSIMTHAGVTDEPELLNRLTMLQASIEHSYAETEFRFSAASAYYALVQRRIGELREERVKGLQTFGEFTERRLAPAMSTSSAAARRQQALSERVDRAAQLLSTRVNMSLEHQNQALLEAMNQRADLQVRLQQTVEGISIAAITYYVVGVLGYVLAALQKTGLEFDVTVAKGVLAPLVLVIAAVGIWRIRKSVEKDQRQTVLKLPFQGGADSGLADQEVSGDPLHGAADSR